MDPSWVIVNIIVKPQTNIFFQRTLVNIQWIGLRENLQENPI